MQPAGTRRCCMHGAGCLSAGRSDVICTRNLETSHANALSLLGALRAVLALADVVEVFFPKLMRVLGKRVD